MREAANMLCNTLKFCLKTKKAIQQNPPEICYKNIKKYTIFLTDTEKKHLTKYNIHS